MSREFDLDALVLATALLLLVGALAIATVPGLGVLVPSPVRGFGEVFGASIVSWLIALALALSALVGFGFLKGRHRTIAGADDAEGDAETGGSDDSTVRHDDAVERDDGASESPGAEEIVGGTLTAEYLQRREELRSRSGPQDVGPTEGLEHAAIAVLLARGHDAETAHERLRTGAWTDDPVAAAFLGDETAGSLGLRRRLYAVVYPHRAFERRFERTLAELEAAVEETAGISDSAGAFGSKDADEADAADRREGATIGSGRAAADDGRGGTEQRVAGGS